MSPQLLLVLAAGLLGVVIVGVGALSMVRSRTAGVSARLDRYADLSTTKGTTTAVAAPRTSPIADRLNQAMAARGIGGRLSTSLAQADLKITPAEWLATQTLAVLGAGFAGYFLFHQNPIFILISAIIGGV